MVLLVADSCWHLSTSYNDTDPEPTGGKRNRELYSLKSIKDFNEALKTVKHCREAEKIKQLVNMPC